MNISAVLLTGGESRRMGTDKATLIFRGKPLWQHQLEILRKLGVEKIFVSARKDPLWRPNDVEFVADAPPSLGPLSGVAATLKRLRTAHLLVLAVDMPFIPTDFLSSSCKNVEPARGLIPMTGEFVEPLAAIYPREVSVDFDLALGSSDFSLQSLCKSLVIAERLILVNMPKDYESNFRSLNEPADLNC